MFLISETGFYPSESKTEGLHGSDPAERAEGTEYVGKSGLDHDWTVP